MSEARRSGVPALLREQLALDELEQTRREALEAEFGADALTKARADIEREDRELWETGLPARLRLRNEASAPKRVPRTLSHGLAFGGATLAAAFAALLYLGPGRGPATDGGEPLGSGGGVERTRIKGLSPRVLAFRKRGEVVEPLEDGAAARAGDLIQLGYVPAGQAHGVLLSIDGRGVVTLHFPVQPARSTALERGGNVLLDRAYALDDAPLFERFILVTSPSPLDVAAVRSAAEALAESAREAPERMQSEPLQLAPTNRNEQHSLTVRKVKP